MAYLGLFFAGMFLCNALPHLLKGLQGEAFYTPWAKPRGTGKSPALENVLWGFANLLVATFLIDRIFLKNVPHGMVALAAGFMLIAVACALIFSKRNAA
ncbi:hypothetical protein HZF05_01375 [Sphingomonas sp. CGMCC 1.13654]|uniref:Uncharacterized protein n=1 Tax=Sphingomonas chungangi TaxID=2683589 RepID=A0A838L255_9SPHN|nr:hypothetical protein [Sphingomonas chungangi]MBA2932735.1 hypothetical protein [Sphingomonas chungangi]MVW56357.1 hypothetical protein [Sphingomonas chungangi]